MKLSVFFDLETTDTCLLGQILNYSFCAVDSDWNIIDECNGIIQVSRLQLPTAGALLANRVDILKHQAGATDSEKEASKKISDFLLSILHRATSDVRIIGYNSQKFDLPFLRTTLIRNGLNPYLSVDKKKLVHADLLFAAHKLVTSNEEFSLISLCEEDGVLRRRLTLQHLCQQFSLLEGEQKHESRDDVLLSIELAKCFWNRFGLDVRSWSSYEGKQFHSKSAATKILLSRHVEYDCLKGNSYSEAPVMLLDHSGNGSLWINLAEFEEGLGEKSIHWKNCSDGALFLTECPKAVEERYSSVAKEARVALAHRTLHNYFQPSTCDVEADIYRLDFDAREELRRAIWAGEKISGSIPDTKELLKRYRLIHYQWGSSSDEAARKALLSYAEYRYGGKAHTHKFRSITEGGAHPSFNELYSELHQKLDGAAPNDVSILYSLKHFYENSDIYAVLKETASPILAAA